VDPDPLADREKEAAALAAADLIGEGMRVGLGTGTTVSHLLPAIARRGLRGLRCVASSPATAHAAQEAGLAIVDLAAVGGRLDIAIDGADQIDPEGWLVKGGGRAHAREKVLAAAAERFVVIASANKAVPALAPPVPLEITRFAAAYTLAALRQAALRAGPESPDGNLIADYLGEFDDPRALAARLSATPGVLEHGLFAPELVSEVLIATPHGLERRSGGKPARAAGP
jgi:ribose 5-phosphate isomerase A